MTMTARTKTDTKTQPAAAERRHVEQMAEQLGLSRPQLAALHAVTTWAVFLRPSTAPSDREHLRAYLDVMGYLPADRKVVASAERSRDAIDRTAPGLQEAFACGEIDPETFLRADEADAPSPRLAGLTRSQLDLLKSILRHQLALDGADLRDLVAQFPFPVTSLNFFGRFVAGGCDDPRKAVRYLRLCTPFFVRIRSLLEGLSNDRFRFLVVQGIEAAKDYEDDEEPADPAEGQQQAAQPQPAAPLEKEVAELLHATINASHDFLGGADPTIPAPFACVKVPEVPSFATDHIDKHEQAQLAAEFVDWLLTGNRDGELLRRKALSVEAERDYRKAKRDIKRTREKRKRHRRNAPADQDDKKAMSVWEKEDTKLTKAIEELERSIKAWDQERAKRKTILRQLDAAEAGRARIRKFRDEVADARRQNKRLVLSLLGGGDGATFCKYLDRAFSAGPVRGRQGLKWLRAAAVLLSPAAAQHVRDNRVQGFGSATEQQLRDFPVAPNQMVCCQGAIFAPLEGSNGVRLLRTP